MSTITFDGLEFVDTLTKAGVPEAQAKAEAKAISNAFKQIVDSKDLATKQDLAVLEERMTANLYKAMLIQVFAIAGLVIAVVKFMN
jgi:polyhydroxyalkanoate synthesis regulator phasin